VRLCVCTCVCLCFVSSGCSYAYMPGNMTSSPGMCGHTGEPAPESITDKIYGETQKVAALKMADLPEVDLSKVPPVCVYVYVFMCAFVCVCACVCLCLCLCVQARTHICKMLCSPILKASGSTSPSFLHCVHEAVHTCDM